MDSTAVQATIVMELPQNERGKALKFYIWGPYIFRGLAMIFTVAFFVPIITSSLLNVSKKSIE